MPPARAEPEVPAKLEEIIHKALEKDRDLRYQHASDIRTDLQRLKRDTESGKAPAVATVLRSRDETGGNCSMGPRWRLSFSRLVLDSFGSRLR